MSSSIDPPLPPADLGNLFSNPGIAWNALLISDPHRTIYQQYLNRNDSIRIIQI